MSRYFFLAISLFFSLSFSHSVSAKFAKRDLIPVQQYRWLTPTERKAYITEVQKHFVQIEEAHLKSTPVASFSLWMASAFAEGEQRCLIGGADQPVIGGKCSSRNNECDGKTDTFKCGPVFGGVCLDPRAPVGFISSRCRIEAEKTLSLTPEQYVNYSIDAQILYNKHCPEEQSDSVPCKQFRRQMETTRTKFTKTADTNGAAAQPGNLPGTTGADGAPAATPPAKPANPPPAATQPANAAATPPAPAETAWPANAVCVDMEPSAGTCVEDSVAVGRNLAYEACKPKNLPALTCGKFEMLNCRYGKYEAGIRSAQLAARAEEKKADLAQFAAEHNVKIDDLLADMKKSGGSIYPQGMEEDMQAMLSQADDFNRKDNLCHAIAFLKERRNENKRCDLQSQRFPAQAITLKEIAELGNKNQNEIPAHVKSCEQGKEFIAGAVTLSQACSGENCHGPSVTIFPLEFKANNKDGGLLQFINHEGKTKGLEIISDGKGSFQVKDDKGGLQTLKPFQKVAPCKVMMNMPIPFSQKKNFECYPLQQYAKAAAPNQPAAIAPATDLKQTGSK